MPNKDFTTHNVVLGTSVAVISGVSAHQLFKQAQLCTEGKNKLLLEVTERNQEIKNIAYEVGKYQVLYPQTNYEPAKIHSLPIVTADRRLIESEFKNAKTFALSQIQQLKTSMFGVGERYFPDGEWGKQSLKILEQMNGFEDKTLTQILDNLNQVETILEKAHIDPNKAQQETFFKSLDILRKLNASTAINMYADQPFQKEMASLIFQSTGSIEQYARSMNLSTNKFAPLKYVIDKLAQIDHIEYHQLLRYDHIQTLARKAANLKLAAKGLVATALLGAAYALGHWIFHPKKS